MFGRMEALQAKKDILDARIDKEHARPRPDAIRLQSLKRMRLRLEDHMVRVQSLPHLISRSAPRARGGLRPTG